MAAAREAQVRKLQEVVKLESEEVRSLNEFLIQVWGSEVSLLDSAVTTNTTVCPECRASLWFRIHAFSMPCCPCFVRDENRPWAVG